MKKHYIIIIFIIPILLYACNLKNKNTTEQKTTDTISSNNQNEPIEIDSFVYAYEQLVKDSSLLNASMSIYIYDDSLNEVILEHNPDLALVPASTLKLATTGASLIYLGGKRNFSTTVQYDGQIIDGHILQGNIYIKGGGDPALGSKFYKGTYGNFISKWATAIAKLGIDSITGRIIGDASYFSLEYTPITWSYGETGDYYCTAASGLTAYDNRYEIKFYGSNRARKKATSGVIKPFIPDFYYENKTTVVSGRKKAIYILGAPYSHERILKGNIPASGQTYTLEGSIPDPPYLVAYQLSEQLKKNGIKIGELPTTLRRLKYENDSIYRIVRNKSRQNITSSYSPSVSSLVGITNKVSNNLFAEHLLKHIAKKRYSIGETEAGAKAVVGFWKSKGIDTRGFNMFDGSGISRYNSITARQLVGILNYMQDSTSYFTTYYNSLPIAGQTGTLKSFCDGTFAEGKIRAKSGTMSRVRSYAGFVTANSGRTFIFAFTVNNYTCHTSQMKVKIENFMTKLVENR